MGWGHIIAAWIMGSNGERPTTNGGGVNFGLLICGLASLAIIVAGVWPK
jgi:hypothetical protein